jgi:enoyl-[acyl-carrier protein] reductase I
MPEGSSLLTLSYLGAVRAIPNYNVMGVAKSALEASVRYLATDLGPDGIRVNAISAGPVKTLAASGIKGFRGILGSYERVTPLRRNIQADDVGKSSLYLLSDLASGVTGEVHYVDAGFSISSALTVDRTKSHNWTVTGQKKEPSATDPESRPFGPAALLRSRRA